MERMNDILKPVIGIIMIISFVAAFSSCEQKSDRADGKDTIIKYSIKKDTIIKDEHRDQNSSGSFKEKMSQEGQEIEVALDSLKEKAKRGSKKAQQEVSHLSEKWKSDRRNVEKDSSDSSFRQKWEELKVKTRNAIDSLRKKI